ncbi:YciI family protein [Pseudomonas mangrovi]|uniref:Dehydrogenase n=1 Tax=Pseudomonas mangrovi TaxID=2161748 RepID=A0A2T5P6T3_9PSED|nr:YciI family protein [Pseudomonas mangrovi]PTU73451.1 dehydrogenase [Pseudomonas mangrovi]
MKYLCLVYCDEALLHSLPDSPQDEECHAFAESVQNSGRLVAAQALQPVSSATTLRVRGGQLSITDGPFAETKEQLAGFYLIEARDLNEAIQIGSRIPPARVGSIEVRPVRELDVEQPSGTQVSA